MAHGIMPNYGEMDGGNEPVRARMSLGWKKIGLAVCLAGLGGVLMGAASDSKNSLRQILLAEGGLLSEGALLRDLRAGGKEEEEEISGAERRQQPMVKGLAKMVREVMWEKLKTGEDAGKKIPREEDVLNLKRRVASSEATNTPVATVKDLPADLTGAGVDYDEEFASSAETAQVTAAKAHPTDKRVNIFHKKEPGPSRTAAPVSTNKASGRGFGGEDAVGDGRRQAVKHAPISAIKTARDTLDNDLWLSLADANSSVADTAAAAAAQNDTSAFPTESARASSDSNNGSSKKSKVIVKLYMESRCPACKNYVGEIVSSVLLAQGMKDIMDFKLVPWGNAEVCV